MTEKTPKVYAAIHKVLGALVVEKNQTLPSNMGGGKYAPASAVANEIKRLFYQENLILLTKETVNEHAVIDAGNNKTRVSVSITGTYTAIHVEDGSSVEFSGTGDGLATGTAVASNIASTNAQKNGLLRTFLVSEEGVEEDSQREQAQPKETAAQRTAKAPAATKPKKTATAPKASGADNKAAQERIAAGIESGALDRDRVTALHNKIAEEQGKEKGEVIVDLLKALEAGEVA